MCGKEASKSDVFICVCEIMKKNCKKNHKIHFGYLNVSINYDMRDKA